MPLGQSLWCTASHPDQYFHHLHHGSHNHFSWRLGERYRRFREQYIHRLWRVIHLVKQECCSCTGLRPRSWWQIRSPCYPQWYDGWIHVHAVMAICLESCGSPGTSTLIGTISTLDHSLLRPDWSICFYSWPSRQRLSISSSSIALRSISPYCIAKSWSSIFLGACG